jgi:ABC-type branched-subunit amino acid transport system substrate-binding protein
MIGKRRTVAAAAAAAAALLLAAGCSSSSTPKPPTDSGFTAPSSKETITVGVLTDETGAAASGNKTSVDGVRAGTYYAARNGYTIKFVVGDTATNPATALTVATKFVTQDHVLAVIANSSLTFGAATYLTQHNVPVIGAAEDGPEWAKSSNMFSVFGELQSTKVATTEGAFFKQMGVTNLGVVAYSLPVAANVAEGVAISAQIAGVQVGYKNTKLALGGSVGPVVLQLKSAKVDGLVANVDPDTAFAIIKGLRDQGVNLKVALLPTGYGGDLLDSGAGAKAAAQGVYFLSGYEPVEMQTAATKQFVADLSSASITTEPAYAMYNGYTSVGLLVQALQGAGANPTQASLLASLSNIHKFTAMGLFGDHSVDPNDRENVVAGADNCQWVAQFVGNGFRTVPNALPICGTLVPGKTVPTS